jgi:hypothetical protein
MISMYSIHRKRRHSATRLTKPSELCWQIRQPTTNDQPSTIDDRPSLSGSACFRRFLRGLLAILFPALDGRLFCLTRKCPVAGVPVDSRWSATSTARDRFIDVFRPEAFFSFPARVNCAAFLRMEVGPLGGLNFTPARRALDRPATACGGDRAPCFPSRDWCICSRTNSPA